MAVDVRALAAREPVAEVAVRRERLARAALVLEVAPAARKRGRDEDPHVRIGQVAEARQERVEGGDRALRIVAVQKLGRAVNAEPT